MNIKGILFGGEGGGSVTADLGLLILRLGTGVALAAAHGLGKMPPKEKFIEGVGSIGFPAPEVFAWLAGLSELVGGVLIAVGLLTRPAAFFVAFTMGVAFFLQHGADPFEKKEKAMLFGLVALMLIFTGAGRFSIDAAAKKG
jgi:putative oxidoreductase